MSVRPLERIRERVKLPLGGSFGRGQIQVGKGALISKAKERTTTAIEKVKELRPGILPKAVEKLSVWYPGKRLAEVLAKPQLKITTDFTSAPAPKVVGKPEKTWIHY